MQLYGQFSVGSFELIVFGVTSNAQYFVIVLDSDDLVDQVLLLLSVARLSGSGGFGRGGGFGPRRGGGGLRLRLAGDHGDESLGLLGGVEGVALPEPFEGILYFLLLVALQTLL